MKSSKQLKKGISVLVPAYNEVKTINKVLLTLNDLDNVNQIIVIDDNSSDGTVLEVKKFKGKKIMLLENKINIGKGATIRQAFEHIESEYSVIQDADLELNPNYIQEYFKLANEHNLDAVFGYRFTKIKLKGYPLRFSVANKIYTLIINYLTNSKYKDVNCGHKFFRTEVLFNLDFIENHFGADPEIAYIVAKKNLKFLDYPIEFIPRSREEGKKITWQDGIKFFKVIYKVHQRFKGRKDLINK